MLKLSLLPQQIHLWQILLDRTLHRVNWARKIIDDTEYQKSLRFVQTILQERYQLKRAILRTILTNYIEKQPQNIRFERNEFGKPFLSTNQKAIYFNLSDSEDWLVIAIAMYHNIGVDIETINPDLDYLALSERFFTTQEYESITRTPHEQQQLKFFRMWTQKEAIIKALGKGLHMPLTSFVVNGDENPNIISADEAFLQDCFLHSFILDERTVGTIALQETQQTSFEIIYHTFDFNKIC